MNIILKQFIEIMTVMYSGHFGDWYKKYLEVVISNFTMHLIILKNLQKTKMPTEEKKKMKQNEVEAKDETFSESVFIHLNMN